MAAESAEGKEGMLLHHKCGDNDISYIANGGSARRAPRLRLKSIAGALWKRSPVTIKRAHILDHGFSRASICVK